MRAPWRSWTAAAGLLAHELFSQVDLHRAYGGVVPELASRDHVRRLLPLIAHVLGKAATAARTSIDGVAYTAGPGPDRGAADRGGAGPQPRLRLGGALASGCTTWRDTCWRRSWSPSRRPSRTWRCWCPAATPSYRSVGHRRATACSGRAATMPPGRPSTRPRSCSGCRTRAARSSRELAAHGRAGRLQVPAPDARSAGTGVQLLGTEDRGAARGAQAGR